MERVWTLLHMPRLQRLDMVLHFTKRDQYAMFDKALGLWEEATAAVLQVRGGAMCVCVGGWVWGTSTPYLI